MKTTQQNNPVLWSGDAWRLGLMAAELWTTAATTIMLRSWTWAAHWPYSSNRIDNENQRMVNEKITAAMQMNAEWWKLTMKMVNGSFNPWLAGQQVLAPLHRKTKGNARRLLQRKKL